tara:strand:- start:1076 stop:3037 length:1962 start_codon:yes stop_codon:yes gene_type:complete
MSDLKHLRDISEEDRKMLENTQMVMGPEPAEMGFVKNLFWGKIREDLIFPYPEVSPEEKRKADDLLAKLDDYLKNEHPAIRIDREQEIPRSAIDRLFELGVMGMTIPEEYGGLGLSITSYNRVLERLGRTCASTSVVVSAHQSIGCKALMLFGTAEQKKKWLPIMARSALSAFCLSEPNVGCDAGGQETRAELSEDGTHYILNGEKKWSTSAAYSALFTVLCNQQLVDPKTGRVSKAVTALICTPDMEGVDIFEKNRSKCGVRGTWQGRIRFTNVRVPKENLLHKEGQGLKVALTCLNYGRCTLSSGILGSAKGAMEQAVKWSQTRYQFERPLSAFELVQDRIANMGAMCYAIDAMLYMTTGMLDRDEKDIMVETAVAKVFASHYGWQVIDDALQIMGGEGYMTENEVERAYRDARLYKIGEGANEVMRVFVFGYGGKQLAEQMLAIRQALFWDGTETVGANLSRIIKNALNPQISLKAMGLGAQIFLGIKPPKPHISNIHPSLREHADKWSKMVADHNHQFKLASQRFKDQILKRQLVQARLGDGAMWLHAMACVLSKLDSQLNSNASGKLFERDKACALHFLDLAEHAYHENVTRLKNNADKTMSAAAQAVLDHNDTLPNKDFYIHETSPVAKGEGKPVVKDDIQQFPGDR